MTEVYDRRGSLTRQAHTDPSDKDGRVVIASEQDCTDLVAENRRLREATNSHGSSENFRLVARVPVPIVEKAMQEGWFHDEDAWKRWLNDSDNRDFRVHTGRI